MLCTVGILLNQLMSQTYSIVAVNSSKMLLTHQKKKNTVVKVL
jgi:hypothetical protein